MTRVLRLLGINSWLAWSVAGVISAFAMLFPLALWEGCVNMAHAAQISPLVPANPSANAIPMLNHFDVYLDDTGQMTIDEMAQQNMQEKFTPYATSSLPKQTGALWLRFTVAERNTGTRPATMLLDLGQAIPEKPLLYIPQYNAQTQQQEWHMFSPEEDAVFLMPEAQDDSITSYVRLDGAPSIWFNPMLRTPDNAAASFERIAKPAAVVALAIVMLLCILRGLTEAGQWRIWVGLYTAVVFIYAYMGLPVTSAGYITLEYMLPVITPGLAIILLSHVARHLLRSYQTARSIDWQYRVLVGVGFVMALLPLLPGLAWLSRYLELWPLTILLFVPTTIAAWLSGTPGARRFLLGCFLPPLGVALAFAGMEGFDFIPNSILGTLPLWGVALGALVIAGTASPTEYAAKGEIQRQAAMSKEAMETLVDEDPNLRLVSVGEAQSVEETVNTEQNGQNSAQLEEYLRWPMDDLLRHITALESCALPMAAREHMSQLSQACRDISKAISAPAKEHSVVQSLGGIKENIFDLQSLLRQAHDSVSAVADSKNIALSWFMPPQLGRVYRGDALQLLFVLRLLLESAVRATHRGAVQLSVRRVPESVDPGNLLFTVTDTGTGKPPQERSVSSLARAWELAASCHGFLGVETNAHGASISFTVHCEITAQDMLHTAEEENQKSRVLIVSDSADNRQLWAFFIDNMPCTVLEARTGEEALALYKDDPVQIILFDARMPSSVLQNTIEALHSHEERNELARATCLAISAPREERETLQAMGFEYVLPLPTTRSDLRGCIDSILEEYNQRILQREDTQEPESPRMLMYSEPQETEDVLKYPDFMQAEDTETDTDADAQYETMAENVAEPLHEPSVLETPMQDVLSAQSTNDTGEKIPELDALLQAIPDTPSSKTFIPNDAGIESVHDDDEIIDTGMPILDMHAPVSSVPEAAHVQNTSALNLHIKGAAFTESALQKAAEELVAEIKEPLLMPNPQENAQSLSEGILLLDLDAHQESSDVVSRDEAAAVAEESLAAVEPNVTPQTLPPHEEVETQDSALSRIFDEAMQADVFEPLVLDPRHDALPKEQKGSSSLVQKMKLAAISSVTQTKNDKKQAQAEQQESKASRPAPSEDKSNAVYVSSLVDVGSMRTGGDWVGEPRPRQNVAESRGEHTKTEQNVGTPKPVRAKPNQVKQSSMQQTPMEATLPRSTPVQAKERTVQERQQGGHEWVGEPRPRAAAKTPQEPVKKKPIIVTTKTKPVIRLGVNKGQKGAKVVPAQEQVHTPTATQAAKVQPKVTMKKAEVAPKEERIAQAVVEALNVPLPQAVAQDSEMKKPVVQTEEPSVVPIAPTPKAESNIEARDQLRDEATKIQQIMSFATAQEDEIEEIEEKSPLDNLLRDIDIWMLDAKKQFAQGSAKGVETAAGFIASNAEGFGLRTLGRLARTVEAAARAEDHEALGDLLPELEINVERNRIAMKQ